MWLLSALANAMGWWSGEFDFYFGGSSTTQGWTCDGIFDVNSPPPNRLDNATAVAADERSPDFPRPDPNHTKGALFVNLFGPLNAASGKWQLDLVSPDVSEDPDWQNGWFTRVEGY